jgi:CRISPR/Cas system-associated exonuclease Cas4 (RecB family)
MELPKGYLSVSQIRSYLRCPRQYELKYIYEQRETYGPSLLVGKAFHSAIEAANRAKASGNDIPDLRDIFNDSWESEKDSIRFGDDDDPGQLKDRGIEMTVKYYNEYGQHLNPDFIETDFEINVADVPLKGFIDLAEKDGTIRDFKTTGTTPQKDVADSSIQLTAYALAYRELTGQEEAKVGLDYVINQKRDIKIIRHESTVSESRIKRFENTVHAVATAIDGGIFYSNEEGMACSFCSFKSQCKGR